METQCGQDAMPGPDEASATHRCPKRQLDNALSDLPSTKKRKIKHASSETAPSQVDVEDDPLIADAAEMPLVTRHQQIRTQCVGGVSSVSILLRRGAGNATWILAVPGHGVRRVTVGGRCGITQRIGRDLEPSDSAVITAHLKAHFPGIFYLLSYVE